VNLPEHGAINAFDGLMTPALVLDRDKLRANASRLAEHIGGLGCRIRPHVKTHKSAEVARDILAAGSAAGITVSTLKEARYFFERGFDDIFYAVGIAPNKFTAAAALIREGCKLSLTLDSLDMARALEACGRELGLVFPVLIELDTDGHRSGTRPDGHALLELGACLEEGAGTELRGVMTHAGESYNCSSAVSQLAMARQERDRSLMAAGRLRAAGLSCPVVSIGSTPTAFAIDDLKGITEVRAGVYATFDLVMANLGVCAVEDIALSVLVTVTGHQVEKNWLITDGGWMALSRDRGTATQARDYGYGAVQHVDGTPTNLLMSGANQEHGIISPDDGLPGLDFSAYPLGSQLRVLPNHACATAAQHERLEVLDGGVWIGNWPKASGW
jgi:D-serine deaminase-like pyridoxal phosphate-dependent protein